MANIMLTQCCNLSCPYCFANEYVNEQSPNLFIDRKTFDEELQFLLGDGTQNSIGLIGGEPTIHPDFQAILEKLANIQQLSRVVIYTNGILVSKYLDTLSNEKFKLLINCNDLSYSPQLEQKFLDSYEKTYYAMQEQMTPGVNFYKPDFDYSYVIALFKKFPCKKVRVSISVPNSEYTYKPLEYFSLVKQRVIAFFKELKGIGTIPFFDCNVFPSCLLTLEDVELFADWGAENPFLNIKTRQVGCRPVVDLMPDKTAIRCFGLSEYTKEKISDFACYTDLFNYYLRTIDSYGINTVYDKKCLSCYKYKTVKCSGGCLVYKIDKILSRRKENDHEME